MEKTFASIITIGDELLIGQVIDTNSAFIAQQLNNIGIAVKHRVAVGDNKQDIINALEQESKHANIILITGGLGPTADDITKPLLCEYFGGKMILHEKTLQQIEHLFTHVLKRPMIERNRKQAEVPDVCTVLINEKGTAPGMMFEKDGKIFIAMPGVPYEMQHIITERVLPILQEKFDAGNIIHKTLLTFGIGESFLAEILQHWESNLPQHIKLAYLPNHGLIRLRLTGFGKNKELLQQEINTEIKQLKTLAREYVIAEDDLPLELIVSNLLKQTNKTLATAESCTGGSIASAITAHTGASSFFTGSIVCYDNKIKTQLLGVSNEVLQTVGAVSKQTVELMASNVLQLMNTDFSIAVSGIMGPTGATTEKPVGLVWIAVANKEKVVAKKFQFRLDRTKNIQLTVMNSFIMLRELIIENK